MLLNRRRLLNLGYPAFSPRFTRRKKAANVLFTRRRISWQHEKLASPRSPAARISFTWFAWVFYEIETRCCQASRRSCKAALYKRQASASCLSSSSLSRRVVKSRYLKVLRMCLLVLNVPLYGGLGDRPDAADVVAPRPQAWEIRLQPRKLVTRSVRCESFKLCHQPCWRCSRVALNKHVNVVGHDLQSVNRRNCSRLMAWSWRRSAASLGFSPAGCRRLHSARAQFQTLTRSSVLSAPSATTTRWS